MISDVVLLHIHLRFAEIFDSSDLEDGWFGRKPVVVLGDLLQLSSVNADPPLKKNKRFRCKQV